MQEFAKAAGMMSAAVAGAEEKGDEKECFFAGCVGEQDWEALNDMVTKNDTEIMFPGVIAGWDSEENARKYLKDAGAHADQNVTKVIYVMTTKSVSAVKCRQFCNRLSGKIESIAEGSGDDKV